MLRVYSAATFLLLILTKVTIAQDATFERHPNLYTKAQIEAAKTLGTECGADLSIIWTDSFTNRGGGPLVGKAVIKGSISAEKMQHLREVMDCAKEKKLYGNK